ncbi:MAG: hypothetical protein H6824_14135 [Planctomycetaceae bacterium]|nr:hypothetical protein [Planctomycetaceae bacterium]
MQITTTRNQSTFSYLLLMLLMAGSIVPVAFADEAPESDAVDAPLVVHEWGTFTSFSGSNGVRLEFRPLTQNDLPGFVSGAFTSLFSKQSLRAIQRLETPVTYFYTDVERDVRVSVDFPSGLLTEFYPPPRIIKPEFTPGIQVPTNTSDGKTTAGVPIREGHADWGKFHLIPVNQLAPGIQDEKLALRIASHVERTMVPETDGNPYGYARMTDSAIVQVRHPVGTPFPSTSQQNTFTLDPSTRFVAAGDYFEKFLFYRGVGQFDLPVSMSSENGETFHIQNDGDFPLTGLFLVEHKNDKRRFTALSSLPANSTVDLKLPPAPIKNDTLVSEMVTALVQAGLYEKEATSMVRTWSGSWFHEEGTRLFYIIPDEVTDKLLPLHVSPQPTEQVRVMVGRLEFLAPDVERQVEDMVTQSYSDRALVELAANGRAPQFELTTETLTQLQQLGRFADPALVRVAQITESPALRSHAQLMRRALQNTEAEQ